MTMSHRFGCRAVLLALTAGLASGFAAATTLTVAQDGTGDYATIQEAIDAARAGDTVFVRNGVYATGGRTDTFTTAMSNRVFIDKPLTLVGESKEQTIVKGAHASTPADSFGLGLGPDAVRCIGIGASNVVISNLTVTGGATHVPSGNDNCDGNGGGIYMLNGYSGVQIVDCIISNNVAQRAAGIRHGNDARANHYKCLVARCWFDGNKAADRDPIGRGLLLVHSLCTRHYHTSCLFYSVTAVNCTFADGNCRSHNDNANARSYNCIYADTFYKMDDAGSYSNCLFNHAYGMSPNANTNAFCVFSAGYDHFMAPVLNDYRLHDGATFAIGRGDAAYLAQVDLGIPEGCRYTDFYGHAFTPQNGKINIGCSQQAITPAGGRIALAGQSGMSVVQSVGGYGCTMDCGLYSFGETSVPVTQSRYLAYLHAETYPMTLRIRHDASVATSPSRVNGLHSLVASGADTMTRFPLMDGSFVVMAPPAGKTLTLAPSFNAAVRWVDRASTAEAPDGSEARPYASLQAAINSLASGSCGTIFVRAGTYDNETGTTAAVIKNRIHSNGRQVRLVSADGVGKATILGAADPGVPADAWPFGCGAGAMRCAYLEGGCAIQGFALTQGHSHTDADGTGRRGAALFLVGGAQALDCVITNNIGYQGVALNGAENGKVPTAWAFRCRIVDNYPITPTTGARTKSGGTAGIVRSTSLGSCLLQNNHGNNFGGYESQYTCQCTIVGGSDNGYVVGSTGASLNLLVAAPVNSFNGQLVYGGVCDFGAGAFGGGSDSVVRADPLLAAPDAGDCRLGSVSQARTYGVTAHPALADAQRGDYYMLGATDLYGAPFRFADGKPVCGAVQAFAPTVVVAGAGVEPHGTVVVATGAASVTFTATSANARPYLGFVVNGETQKTERVTCELPIPRQDDYPEAYTVAALYDTNWYVDPAGDDGAFGTETAPKKTLKGALEHALAGDVVHVAAGTYATEKMYQTQQLGNNAGAFDHAARAVIPEGVTMVGAGAATTFIVGASDPAAADADLGCGPNAVRCVAIGKNARLSGFTLTGGRTDRDGNADNFHGGGVLGWYRAGELPQITDCVITNCVGRRGGGAMFGDYNRCRFVGNTVINGGNGSAIRGNGGDTALLRNSILDRNTGWATVYMVSMIENCTLGADNMASDGAKDGATVIQDCPNVNNTLLLGKGAAGGTSLFSSCAYGPETKRYLDKVEAISRSGCIEGARSDELAVEPGTYMPIVGANLGIDAADAARYTGGELDCNGKRRLVNGSRLDIGAVEADWLAAYSAAIGSRVHVTEADGAVDCVDGKVVLPAGASLALSVGRGGRSRRYDLVLTVAAESSCAVVKDGEPLAAFAPGTGTLAFAAAADQAQLMLSAAGAGATTVEGLKVEAGFMMNFR